jgi:hypothetical protein
MVNYNGCPTSIDRMISNFTATGGSHKVTLAWHAVSFDEGTRFEIWRSMNGGQSYDNNVGSVDYDPVTEDYTFIDGTTGLGMTYYYKIRDTEGDDWWGPVSAGPYGVPNAPPPSPKPVLSVDHLSDQQVHLCLTQGSQYANYYLIHYRPDGGNWGRKVLEGESCRTLDSLQNGTIYCFRAQGFNSYGQTDSSAAVWAIPMAPPSDLQYEVGSQHIHLWWNAVQPASGYRVHCSPSGPGGDWLEVGDTTATTLTGLQDNTLYCLYVVAYDRYDNETEGSNMVRARPGPEAAIATNYPPPTAFALGKNRPNPFGARTAVTYQLARPCAQVSLSVYDIMGRQVRSLVNRGQLAGRYEVEWDGCDDEGLRVPPGVYFYRLEAGNFSKTEKMLRVK